MSMTAKYVHTNIVAEDWRAVGEIVSLQVSTSAKVTWCYVTDPEGNVIELQSWSE